MKDLATFRMDEDEDWEDEDFDEEDWEDEEEGS